MMSASLGYLRKATLTAILGLAFWVGLAAGERFGQDAGELSNPLLDWLHACWQEPNVASQLEEIQNRTAAKDRIATETAAGRLPLREAARFRDLTDRRGRFSVEVIGRQTFPDASEEEVFCRLVIRWVELRTYPEEPERARAAAARLQAELDQQLLRRAVDLPGVFPILGPGLF